MAYPNACIVLGISEYFNAQTSAKRFSRVTLVPTSVKLFKNLLNVSFITKKIKKYFTVNCLNFGAESFAA